MRNAINASCAILIAIVLLGFGAASAQTMDYQGEWVCVAVDLGDGVKVTQYEGASVRDLANLRLNADGTMSVTTPGGAISGTWKEENGGISAQIEGEVVPFELKDGQLVNASNGVTMYLEKAGAKPMTGGLLSLIKGSKYTGHWIAAIVDEGDGVQKQEIDGIKVRDLMSFQIDRDGTLVFTTAGADINGSWYEIDGGIVVTVQDETLEMRLQGDMLVVKTEGVTIYLYNADKPGADAAPPTQAPVAASFAGTWDGIRYEMAGYTMDIKQLFPDGCTLVLREDGTGEAFITKDYTEQLTWTQEDDDLTLLGSYIYSSPVWNAEKEELSMFYGSSAVSIVFQKSGREGPALAPIPSLEPAPAPVPGDVLPPTPVPESRVTPTREVETTPAVTAVAANQGEPLLCETELFSMTLFGSGWAENQGWRSDREDYAAVRYDKTDAGGAQTASVALSVSIEDVRNYRDKIKKLQQYADKAGKERLDSAAIGGITFAFAEYEQWGWTYLEYAARVPGSRVSVFLTVEQPENMGDDLKSILDSIAFDLPVLTPPNVDPPLPEDGTPYRPVPKAASVGDREIKATWLKPDRSIILDSIFNNQIALSKERLYVLTGTTLYAYNMQGEALVPDTSFAGGKMTFEDKYEYLANGQDGILFVSQGMFNILAIKDGGVIEDNDQSGDLAMHPSGEWGISFWANADPMLVKASGSALTREPWVLSNLSDAAKRQGRFSSISCVAISDTSIYVAGTDAQEGDAQRVAVFDLEGRELFTFGNKDWTADDAFGSVTGIAELPGGILVLDGNYRAFKLFSFEGEFLGQAESDALLGTDYPWLSAMVPAQGGVLVAAAQSRQDESADELLVFHVSGF